MATTKLFGKDLSQYEELDIDDILEQLSPEELEMLAGEVDPDVSVVDGSCSCNNSRSSSSSCSINNSSTIWKRWSDIFFSSCQQTEV